MINAQITNAIMGITESNIPFVQIEVQYVGEDSKPIRATTDYIFMISPEEESLKNSGMGEVFVTLLMIAGTPTWKEIIGKVIRIETNAEGKIIKLQNALTDLFVDIEPFTSEESTEEDETIN